MMDAIKSCISKKFIEGYVRTPLTLNEQMLVNVAVQLCHGSKLKNDILRISESLHRYENYCNFLPFQEVQRRNKSFIKQWEESITKQSTAICKMLLLPHDLETELITRIHCISLQLLYWTKQCQNMCDVSREFVNHFLIPSDWTGDALLNEGKIAERLVQNVRIHVCHRYRIACIYCLEPFITCLWDQLSTEQQINFCRAGSESGLVRLWSHYMTGNVESLIGNHNSLFWEYTFYKAIKEGLKMAVIYCWEKISESRKQEVAITTVCVLVESGTFVYNSKFPILKHCNSLLFPPTQYEGILCFLLSQMSEEQIVKIFEMELENEEDILKCFLEWPYQDIFMSIITKLWNVLRNSTYISVLFELIIKYINNQDYDYGSLLIELLSHTPQPYKCYIFRDGPRRRGFSEGEILMLRLVEKHPFELRDMCVLLHILKEAAIEGKISNTFAESKFPFWREIILQQNVELVNWLSTRCLPEDMAVDFKMKFFHSGTGHNTFFYLLKDGKPNQVERFLDWGLLSTENISEFKSAFFSESPILTLYESFRWELQEDCLDCMDRILQWCLPLRDDQKQFKKHFVQKCGRNFCFQLLAEAKWKELVQFLTWCFSSEEAIERFKQEIFHAVATDVHSLLIRKNQWQDAELLFKWFQLSPGQIKQLKKDTLLNYVVYNRTPLKQNDLEDIKLVLRWCCTDKETVYAFQERYLCRLILINENIQSGLQNLEIVVKETLCDLAMDQQD